MKDIAEPRWLGQEWESISKMTIQSKDQEAAECMETNQEARN